VRSMVACHARPTERLAGPRPGGPVQLRSGPRAHAAARASSAWSPRASRSWDGPVVASRRQDVAGELVGTTGRASGNKSGGEAHRGRLSTARRGGGSVRRRMVGSLLEGGLAVTLTSSWSCEGGRER
jgi:hypothetical protein